MNSTVLVAGGAGYVGSHAAKALAEHGFEPVVVDDLRGGHDWAVRWGPLVRADIGDGDAMADVVRRIRPCAILHFAGDADLGESVREPMRYWRNNVAASLSLMEAAADAGVGAFVFSSSASVYGAPAAERIGENQAPAPLSPYGRNKWAVEMALSDLAAAGRLNSVSLRYFNAAGADPAAEIGEAHEPETHLLPRLLDVALGRAPALRLFGADHPTADGSPERDYVHVTDLAAAHVAALRYLLSGGRSCAINLGSGAATSVREAVASVRRITGREIPVTIDGRRSEDPPRLVADIRLAASLLDWRPHYSSLDMIVEDAWRWHRRYHGGSRPAGKAAAGA